MTAIPMNQFPTSNGLLCPADDDRCFLPECAEHGCMEHRVDCGPVSDTASAASLMLANMSIEYTPDEAQVAVLEQLCGVPFQGEAHAYMDAKRSVYGSDLNPATIDMSEITSIDATCDELVNDAKHRAWADQFARDVAAAGAARAKGG
jgi:hypothetical protein